MAPTLSPHSRPVPPGEADHRPRISVITVVRNDAEGFLRTSASVARQTFDDFEYVVIDGDSDDDTTAAIGRAARVDAWISAPDEGIYDAMNQGIARASGEWLLFMNAGDVFADDGALAAAADCLAPAVDVVYSDWTYDDGGAVRADLDALNVRHQAVLYRRALHERYGRYLVGPGVTISDYLFFLAIAHRRWRYCSTPIARCDRRQGASTRPAHFHQRLAVELIFGQRSRLGTALILLAHPVYRFFKRQVLRRP